MNGYTLTCKLDPPPAAMDGTFFRPDTLGAVSRESLAAMTMLCGRAAMRVGAVFEIEGEGGDWLALRQCPPLDRLGMCMQSGTLIVEGDAGDDVGVSMAGGTIYIRGRAGDRVGGPAPDCDRGMTGGQIVVDGDAGDYSGLRQRGGLIAIGGRAGCSPGYRMLAGTMVIGRGPVDHPGLEMQRGTILCLDRRTRMTGGVVFIEEGRFEQLQTVRLILRRLGALGVAFDRAAMTGRFALYSGDRFELNKGELLQWRS